MNINTAFIKAKKQIMHEIEQKEQKGEKADQEKIDLRILELYTSTNAYGTLCFQNMAKGIEEAGLIQGSNIRHTIGTNVTTLQEVDFECWECGSRVFNILDTDYVEIYKQTSYCVECTLCGKRTWMRFSNPKITEVTYTPKVEEYETE